MTIEVPTPSADLISQIETATIETEQAEVAAIAAIREKFARYAKHNGFIKTGEESQYTSNSSWSREAYYRKPGPTTRMRGILCADDFGSSCNRGDQNRGTYGGSKLYLTETGEWLRITRSGSWSHWQGEGEGWACGDVEWDGDGEDTDDGYGDANNYSDGGYGGSIDTLTDAEVGAKYHLDAILMDLGKSMKTMCEKLPERFNRLKSTAELAQRTIEALK